MSRRFIPGAGAEQLQQAVAAGASSFTGGDARYCTLSKNPRARRFFGDVVNPFAVPPSHDTALADPVVSAAELPHLPGSLPRTIA